MSTTPPNFTKEYSLAKGYKFFLNDKPVYIESLVMKVWFQEVFLGHSWTVVSPPLIQLTIEGDVPAAAGRLIIQKRSGYGFLYEMELQDIEHHSGNCWQSDKSYCWWKPMEEK